MSFHILSLPSLRTVRHTWCHRCYHRAVRGTAGAVIALRVVTQAQSSCCVWCHRHSCCAVRGTAGTVIALHVVSQGLLSCHA